MNYYLNIGSNIGDRRDNLYRAVVALAACTGGDCAVSPIVESEPWGFEKWKGFTKAQGHNQAALAPASGTNLIYRSSYTSAPGAVVDMSTRPGTVVQYMLEVSF